MRLPDPLSLKTKAERFKVFSVFVQDQGGRTNQEDAFLKEKEECFALADGVGGIPHGEVAAQLAVESVIWTYKLTKLKPYYWSDKKLFTGRIFRTANWRLFNKRREAQFADGMASTLAVLIISDKKFYVAHVGDSVVWLYRNGKVFHLTHLDRAADGAIIKALGVNHASPQPSFYRDDLLFGDIFFMASDGIADWISDEIVKTILTPQPVNPEQLQQKAQQFIDEAKKGGSTDNLSICLVACVEGKNYL